MCGIFAYNGSQTTAGSKILSGLASLEYRGYDSWGVALKKEDGSIYLEKHTGKIGTAKLPEIASHVGIGHTRWATHGGVTEQNAHPHISADKEVIIVHNGIVENFEEIKKHLIEKGYSFSSETDSEVIVHALADAKKEGQSSKQAMLSVFQRLHGMNAIIAFFPKEETFFAIKNGSPVVFCKSDEGFFIASDASALVQYSKDVLFLEDNELLEVSKDAFTLQDLEQNTIEPTFIHLSYDIEDVSMGDYPHFMLKEIHEQPLILQNIIDTQEENIKQAAGLIRNAYGTYLIACGTAFYACMAGTYLFSKIAGRHVNASIGSEFSYSLDFLKEGSLVIALSQSGETIDIISSLDKAKKRDASIMALTNVLGSTLNRMADHTLLLNAGPEKAVCSTKAYLAKIAFLYLIAHELSGTFEIGKEHIRKAITEIKSILDQSETIKQMAQSIQEKNHMFILGRGVSYPLALESALKIKEVSYVHAEGFAGGELKHGVIALIEKGTPVIIYNPSDETYEDSLSSAHEVKARGAHVIGVGSVRNNVYDEFIEVKNCDDATIMPNVVIAQLLGYFLAVEKGYDPDKPRNLAKSVTVK